jgi:hypothetical protein
LPAIAAHISQPGGEGCCCFGTDVLIGTRALQGLAGLEGRGVIMPISVVDPRAPFRLHQLRQHLDGGSVVGPGVSSQLSTTQCKAADNTAVPDASKLCTAEEAAALIPDGVFLTVSCELPAIPLLRCCTTVVFRMALGEADECCAPSAMQPSGFVGTSCPELLLNAVR